MRYKHACVCVCVCVCRCSTPTMPVHCVVWAKELHKLLFGDRVNSHLYESDVLDKDSSSGPESVYMHIVQALPPVDDATAVRTWAERLFDALFGADIDKRLLIAPDTYKTAICSPRPLYLAAVRSGAVGSDTEAQAAQAAALPDQRLLSLRSAAELWIDTLAGMMTNTASRAVLGSLAFDKDTPADLDFVTASMNLRAYTFGITPQSRFAVKSIAGNIIPAIATTNAIAAGFEVLEAIKIMRGMPIKTACKYTSILRGLGSGNRLFSSANLGAPRPRYACARLHARRVDSYPMR
ncbi:hypothetical protein EON66_01830 [archaeon]|nr:MAG: hypothetical protein EON66_01830 [archaeon]